MAERVRLSKSGRFIADAYEAFLTTYIRHVDNQYFGEPFRLESFQRDNIWRPILGQGRQVFGKFRRKKKIGLIGVPRNGGKSDIACGMLLTIATMEPTYNGEYAIIAYSKEQARKDFGKLKTMIRLDADLSALWEPLKDCIVNRETGAKIMVMPYSEGSMQSWHFNVCILDEVHTYRSSAVYDAVVSGQKGIDNALCLIITTAGPQRSGFLWDLIPQLRDNPDAYVWWLGASDKDGIDDQKVWARLSPMSWVTVDDIAEQRRKLTKGSFERYVLNRFPLEKSADRACKQSDIRKCLRSESGFDINEPFVLGIDGATSGDAFALVAYQEHDGFSDFKEWVYDTPPEETGYYDLVQIEELIAETYTEHRCDIAIDPSRLLLLAEHLQSSYGVPVIGLAQTHKVMCPASVLLQQSVRSGKARLGGCPKLADHIGNCTVMEREPFGWRFSSTGHGQGSERIDAAIAAAMAMYYSATAERSPSFSETGGLWTV